MRALLISTEYPPHVFGGGGTFMHNLVRGLLYRGVEVVVLTRGDISEDVVESGARIVRISSPSLQPRHVWFQIRAAPVLSRLLKEFSPDIVHANSFSGGILLRTVLRGSGVPAVVTVHGYPRHYLVLTAYSVRYGGGYGQLLTYFFGYPVWEALVREEIGLSTKVVAVSDALASRIRRDYGIGDKVVSIPNGVDVNDIRKKASSCRIMRGGDGYILVSGGRLFFEKGFFILPYVMKKLLRLMAGDVKLVLFGDGPMRTKIEKDVRELGLSKHVELLGRVSHEEVICLMARADVVVVPSIYEILPITVLEALAIGRPVAALEAEYLNEFRRRGVKIFSAPSPTSLASLLVRILKRVDTLETGELVQRNREVVLRNFDIGRVAEEYERLYTTIVGW